MFRHFEQGLRSCGTWHRRARTRLTKLFESRKAAAVDKQVVARSLGLAVVLSKHDESALRQLQGEASWPTAVKSLSTLYLPSFQFAINTTFNSAIGCTPFEAGHGLMATTITQARSRINGVTPIDVGGDEHEVDEDGEDGEDDQE